MLGIIRRVAHALGYRSGMSASWAPVPQPKELDQFVGKWVAVKDGHVVTCANNARDLVPALHDLGERGRGAVAQFVPYPSESVMIGVG